MSNVEFIIDPGHGGTDPGTTGFGIQEKDWNLRISLYQFDRLKELGVKVGITRTTDKSLSSNARTDMIRKSGAKLCLSNHWNAFNGTARGVETIHSIFAKADFARKLANAIVGASGLPLRRVFSRKNNSGTDYYFMHRLTGNVETVIAEYGFMDNRLDHNCYLNKDKFYNVAEAVIEEMCKKLGVTYKAPKSAEKPELNIPIVSGKLYRVQVGAFSKLDNAESLQERLEEANLDTYLIQDQGLFKVQIGAYSKKENAEAQAKRVENLGFDTYITTQVGDPSHGAKDEKTNESPTITKPDAPSVSISDGDKVTLNRSAANYVTGQTIPASRKGVTYTVRQTRAGQVLLDEITSWVYVKDVTPAGSNKVGQNSSQGVSRGDRITVTRLYGTSVATSPARTSPISGIVDTIQPNWRNEIRLKNSNGVYIGFARRRDIK